MTQSALRPLSTGEVLDVGFSLYRRHFRTLMTVAVVSQGLPLLFSVYVQFAGGALENIILWTLNIVLSAIGTAIGMGACTRVIADAYLGRAPSAGDAMAWVLPHAGRIFVLSAITTIVIFLGLVLLLVPGMILGAGLAVATCALVLESLSPLDAMNRSWHLTRGHRWKVFLTLVVVLALIYCVSLAALFLGGVVALVVASESGAVSVVAALSGLLTLLIYPYVYATVTVLYYDLRVRKEGLDLEILESQLST